MNSSGSQPLERGFRSLDILCRRVLERFFGPMYEWRFTRWLITRRGGNPDDYKGVGKWAPEKSNDG